MGIPVPPEGGEPLWTPRRRLLVLVVALAAVAGAWRVLVMTEFATSALVFVGLPALLAIALGFHAKPQSVTGSTMRGITIVLLLIGTLAVEGLICIFMAAPIVYLVGFAVAWPIERARQARPGGRTMAAILAPVLLLAAEGTSPATSFDRSEVARASTIVQSAPDVVLRALDGPPDITRPRPAFLRLGFPVPLTADGAGLRPGAERVVEFDRGRLVVRVETIGERRLTGVGGGASVARIEFSFPVHTTPAARWVRLRGAAVELRPAGANATRVDLSISYDRLLDPAWYFAPMQRYAMSRTAVYLAHAMSMPAGAPGTAR